MNLEKIDKYYFLGIGGIGMSALALFLLDHNKHIAGYDRTPTDITDNLLNKGISISFEDSVENIPKEFIFNNENILIVYTPAIPKDHPQFTYFKENRFNLIKRSKLLGLITKNKFTIAIGGTHGKTSTSWMTAHLLRESGIDCFAILGGISTNYLSNYLPAKNKNCHVFVVEADEYDQSFLQLEPDVIIITSTESDHLDIYGNEKSVKNAYQQFANKLKKEGVLIHHHDVKISIPPQAKLSFTYGNHTSDNPKLNDISVINEKFLYSITSGKVNINELEAGVPGIHNAYNTLAALAVLLSINKFEEKAIRKAIKSFSGVKRRFEYIVKSKNIIYIDDYAHHPTELDATISTVKILYPDKKIIGIFQPHLFTRTRDFVKEFAISLAELDEVILLDIYPARELPIEGINSEMLLQMIDLPHKMLVSKEYLLDWTEDFTEGVLITMGAGDIDKLVEPLKSILIKKV